MKYTIIGLGNFGCALAKELTEHGHEVIAIDNDQCKVDGIKDSVAAAYRINATEIEAMESIPFRDSDIVIVSIGESFDDSVKAVSILKILKVKKIYARALDRIHEGVLKALDVDMILQPEMEAADNLVQLLDAGNNIEALKIDRQHYVEKFAVPDRYVGSDLSQMKLFEAYKLRIICACKGTKKNPLAGTSTIEYNAIDPASDYMLGKNDLLVCYGDYKAFKEFWDAMRA